MLRYGPKLCKLRHTAKPPEYDWEDKTYEQKVSYAWRLEQSAGESSSRLSDIEIAWSPNHVSFRQLAFKTSALSDT